jgi:cation transport ATPase
MEQEIKREETEKKKEEPRKESEKEKREKEEEARETETKEEDETGVVEQEPFTRWTKKERKDHLKKRRYTRKERWFAVILFLILLIIFIGALIQSTVQQMSGELIITLLAVFTLVLVITLFYLNHVWYKTD